MFWNIYISRIEIKLSKFEISKVFKYELYLMNRDHGGLSQWGRSNRPRIMPVTVKSLNAPWELSYLVLRRDCDKKIDPCRMLVWLGRRTVP